MNEVLLMFALGYVVIGTLWTLGWGIALGSVRGFQGSGGIGAAIIMFMPWIWPLMVAASAYGLIANQGKNNYKIMGGK